MKRKRFLEAFLGALGAKQIIWRSQDMDSISGTVIYNLTLNEKQDFIWHIAENKVPNDKILELLTYLNNNCLLDGDKIRIPIDEIEIPNIDENTKTNLFEELLSVTVNMVDNGEETDYYYIHQ